MLQLEKTMDNQILEVLARIPMLADITDEKRNEILTLIQREKIPAGTVLFLEHDPADKMYIIEQGQVEILQGEHTEPISILHPHDFFGEMGLLYGNIRNASAKTVTEVSLYTLSQECFQKLMEADTQFAVTIGTAYVERYRDNLRRMKSA